MSPRVPKGKLTKKEFTREMWRICNRRTSEGSCQEAGGQVSGSFKVTRPKSRTVTVTLLGGGGPWSLVGGVSKH